ncbi:hypothetical protein HDU67_000829, partial [Dinochytrium kinnereticum]
MLSNHLIGRIKPHLNKPDLLTPKTYTPPSNLNLLTPKTYIPLPLHSTTRLTSDTRLLIFTLENANPLPTGSHLLLKLTSNPGPPVVRAYTPVWVREGRIGFVIRVYGDDGSGRGRGSRALDALKPGDAVLARGPIGDVLYKG